MKKKYVIFTLITLVLLVTCFNYFKTTNTYVEDNNNQTKITKGISMNLEQTAGAGDYKTVTQSGWPTEGYILNTELSKCENGSTLSWDDTKKVVIVSGNLSDKCYVYFDKVFTLANYVISQYTGTQGENAIYYHNSSLSNGAKDNSYRYAGANPNNYVCFGTSESSCPTDNLYRIIGVIDGKVKLIKYDYANSNLLGKDGSISPGIDAPTASIYKGSLTSINTYYWNNSTFSNIWRESNLNKINLNTNYINNIGTTWANKIATTTWKVGENTYANVRDVVPATTYQYEVGSNAPTTTYDAKIGLMYVSDYGFAASPDAWTLTMYNYNNSTATSNNWMYMGYKEWVISSSSDNSDAFMVRLNGGVDSDLVDDYLGVRPSFNLTSSVTYISGSGSKSDPIIID